MHLALLLSFFILLASCVPGAGGESTQMVEVRGYLSYDYVPVTSSGLDYESTIRKPMRNVYVEAIRPSDNKVVAKGSTDDNGNYLLSVPLKEKTIYIAAWAKMISPSVTIQDNTNDKAPYVIVSGNYDLDGNTVLSPLNASSGWSGSNLTGSYGTRKAAPFAILDSIYSAVKKVKEVRPSLSFKALKVNWSVNNLPASGTISLGQISTSHYNPSEGELYILGKANVDTDEYDRHVIVHEWGHYFEDNLSRSDSMGGQHSSGDLIEKSVAFGEGWGNALSGIVFDPDVRYRDTISSRQQTTAIEFSLEDGTDINPGWYSEVSVQQILFDIYDSTNDTGDSISLGLGPIIDVMTNEQKNTSAITSIYSFIYGLKTRYPAYSGVINALTNSKQIVSVTDAYGTGETNDAGGLVELPIYQTLVVGGANKSATMLGQAYRMNEAQNVRYFRFTAMSSSTTFNWQSSDTYIFEVFKKGVSQGGVFDEADSADPLGPFSDSLSTTAGTEYIIRVTTHPDYLFNTTDPVSFDIWLD